MKRKYVENWCIKELCEGKTLAEMNQFQEDVKGLYALLDELKVKMRAFGIYLLTGAREVIFSTEIPSKNFSSTQIEAKERAMRVAMLEMKDYFTGKQILESVVPLKPKGLSYRFRVDDRGFGVKLHQIKLFGDYIPYLNAILQSPKSVFLLQIDPKCNSFDTKYKMRDAINEIANDIFYRIYYVIAEQQGRKGFLVNKKNEQYTPDMIKKDMDYLLDLYIKILKGELSSIPRKTRYKNLKLDDFFV